MKELSGALGPRHQATAVAQRELSRTLLELGDLDRARVIAVEALRTLDATVTHDRPRRLLPSLPSSSKTVRFCCCSQAGPLSDASLITVACLVRLEANPVVGVGGGGRLQALLHRAKSAIANSTERGGAVAHLAEEVPSRCLCVFLTLTLVMMHGVLCGGGMEERRGGEMAITSSLAVYGNY